MAGQNSTTASPWQAAYPTPKTTASLISKQDVLQLLKSGAIPGKKFLLVDVRRNDHEGGTIRGSINLPAQSLFPSIATVYQLVKAAGVQRVIWYCGSSRGRGPRAAAWFADHLVALQESDVQSLTLEGGIKGWVQGGPDFTQWMDEYGESQWSSDST